MHQIQVQDFISTADINTYEKEQNVIYEHLIKVENNLFIAEKIVTFPIDLFTFQGERDFWNLTQVAFFDATVMAIATLAGKDEFSLRRFKNKIIKDWKRHDVKTDIENEFLGSIKNIDFEKRIAGISSQITMVRNHHIAHLDYETKMELRIKEDKVHYGIELDDLKTITQTLQEMFNVLSFNKYFTFRLWNYSDRPHLDSYYTDIDQLLIFIASKSKFFREVQHMDDERQKWYDALSPDKQDTVDYWRQRVHKLFEK